MPSKDRIDPSLNKWLDPEKRSATGARARGASASPTGRKGLSAAALRLANRLGLTPEELVARIPADTLRRLKYPVIETVEEDGTRTYKRDLEVTEGPRSLSSR